MTDSWAKRLVYRWFVEYNPFYVVSAGCVVVGVNLISSAIAKSGVGAQLAVPAIAEAYAWALIASAAWLMRTGSRRPAVMLALLVVIYQCDPTLHSETCACLGWVGVFAGAAWLASFVGKLYALAWALRLRLSRSALLVPCFGAFGLLVIPRFFSTLQGSSLSVLIACWVFALFAAAAWTRREVTSTVALDAWGRTVLERSTRATWSIWAALALGHVLFWFDEAGLSPAVLWPVALLLSTRWIRSELGVWSAVFASTLLASVVMPGGFSAIALLAAITLALRAFRKPTLFTPPGIDSGLERPYRAAGSETRAPTAPDLGPLLSFTRAEPASVQRLVIGALSGVYLSAWTLGWSGGPWPDHGILLDALLTAALLLLAWKTRNAFAIAPVVLIYLHLGIQIRLLTAPKTALAWGITSVATGFALLAASLLATWRIRKGMCAREPTDGFVDSARNLSARPD